MGSYQLEERLGEGGMGEVWRASHRMLARPAAIKLIRTERLAQVTGEEAKTLLRRFDLEAQVTASLTSPHTVALYDFGKTEEGTFYYVMELLHGLDVERLVERFGPVPAGRCVALLTQACDSLEEAHARVERDDPLAERRHVVGLLQHHRVHDVGYFGPGTFEQFPALDGD